MPFLLIRDDITKVKCDAVVNAANETLLGGGGVDGAIHAAAGPELLAECRTLGGCKTGEAKRTGGYRLPAKYVIHTVGPVWQGGGHGERALLTACYTNSLRLAAEAGCESVAFPLISAGAYGYPKAEALAVASEAIEAFLQENEMLVYLVLFDRTAFEIGKERYAEIQSLIDDAYAEAHAEKPSVQHLRRSKGLRAREAAAAREAPEPLRDTAAFFAPQESCASACGTAANAALAGSLEEELKTIDESFSEMLLRKIDERGITDAACYKRANIDRKLFSKIRSDRLYKPRKTTALAFAVALELPLPETRELLMKAGYALSRSSKFDIIVEYYISRGIYNVFEINEALFTFDQPLLC